MKVSIMPEYDDPSVLVVYDGRFVERASYPIKTSFLIPRNSVISDACSLSHEGQHFCQLYKTVNRGSYDEVSVTLPYPNFYLSFHTPRLDTGLVQKAIDYRIRANHAIKTLEVDIFQPLRSEAFKVTPPPDASLMPSEAATSLVRGFNHVVYRIDSVARDRESAFQIGYLKSDPNPSVDIKFTSMDASNTGGTSYETQRNVKAIIYVLFGTGVLGALALVYRALRSRKTRPGKAP
ncbi:MAG: hypothetical protein HYZ17_11415 [Betaproteobacteria bacterium]|nr:hypothetical protein [Betaproteobacteria bacterium]